MAVRFLFLRKPRHLITGTGRRVNIIPFQWLLCFDHKTSAEPKIVDHSFDGIHKSPGDSGGHAAAYLWPFIPSEDTFCTKGTLTSRNARISFHLNNERGWIANIWPIMGGFYTPLVLISISGEHERTAGDLITLAKYKTLPYNPGSEKLCSQTVIK